MDSTALLLAIATATMAAVTFQAWHIGNEKRDVVLLGTISGLFGVGATAAALL